MKKLSDAQKKKKLWKIFSQFIRLRDKNTCFTCGMTQHVTHAGHFISRSIGGLALYFHEKNVNCQCYRCNIWLRGNIAAYAVHLEKKYGVGILQELDTLKQKTTKDFDFDGLIAHYTEEVKNLLIQ